MPGTFDEQIQLLMDEVGDGELNGHVEYDQVYAKRQHYELTWEHPRGGQAMYLADPLYANATLFISMIADDVLSGDGGRRGMEEAAEMLAVESAVLAPLMWGNLKMSPHVWVDENGTTVYDRPAAVHRLTDDELDALHEIWSDIHPYPWPPNYFEDYEERFNKFIRKGSSGFPPWPSGGGG